MAGCPQLSLAGLIPPTICCYLRGVELTTSAAAARDIKTETTTVMPHAEGVAVPWIAAGYSSVEHKQNNSESLNIVRLEARGNSGEEYINILR